MKKSELHKILQEKEEKYYRLVSLARKSEEDRATIEGLEEICQETEYLYPEEVEKLYSVEEGDWQHGFNSGMLAALRYVSMLDSYGFDPAESNFPELHT
jgi:hypothetical protein